jgi:hypothetical protein
VFNALHSPPAWEAPNLLRFWHLASLDAPTVAVVWSFGFAWIAQIRLPAWSPLLLALVTWIVYVCDRLLDARAGLRLPPLHQLRERHHFHWIHRRIFVPLAGAAAIIAAWMVLNFLPARALRPDSVVAFATLMYFSGVHSRIRLPSRLTSLLSRELLVGTLFTAGCILPVWCRIASVQDPASPLRMLIMPLVFFAVLAWVNCRAIGQWEADRPKPLTEKFPLKSDIFSVSCLLALAGTLASAASLAFGQPRSAAMLAAGAVSALLLAGVDRLRPKITPLLLRATADMVLLIPALLLPFVLRFG